MKELLVTAPYGTALYTSQEYVGLYALLLGVHSFCIIDLEARDELIHLACKELDVIGADGETQFMEFLEGQFIARIYNNVLVRLEPIGAEQHRLTYIREGDSAYEMLAETLRGNVKW